VTAGFLQRDRAITLASLLLLTALSWAALIRGTGHGHHGAAMDSAPRGAAAPEPAHLDESPEDEDAPGYVPP
jgi:hypothetical protein